MRKIYDEGERKEKEEKREYVMKEDEKDGMEKIINVLGGKIKKERKIEENMMKKIEKWIGRKGEKWKNEEKLKGGDLEDVDFEKEMKKIEEEYNLIDERRMLRIYGKREYKILGKDY